MFATAGAITMIGLWTLALGAIPVAAFYEGH